MNDAHKALDQCLALRKGSISMGRGGKGGREKKGEKKEAQRRSDIIREKQSTKYF